MDFLLYAEHDSKHALELCADATEAAEFKNWYWKTMLGKCYYRLGKRGCRSP
jgi:tetratricopeptide repeat protein 8